jgi:hypothetical protein
MPTQASTKGPTEVSAQVSDRPIDITPIPSSQLLEGIEDAARPFTSISGLRSAVKALSKRLYQDTATDEYLVFQHVTEANFAEFEKQRFKIHKGLRVTYCADINTLIIKVPTPEHESAIYKISTDFASRFTRMGLSDITDLKGLGASTYKGLSVRKEADSCWRPLATRPHPMDWPTLIVEVGVSQTLRMLRNCAKWWISNSQGQVKIVLLVKLNRAQRAIHIEKWECTTVTPRYNTRSNHLPTLTATQIQTFDINANGVVTGDPPPLILHFQNILLRQPIPPEQDLIYTTQDLQGWANSIWAGL